jgi:hypothetical protein
VERRHVGADREAVDGREPRLRGRPFAELAFPELDETLEVGPVGEDRSGGEPPLVGEVGLESFDRAGERDHGRQV